MSGQELCRPPIDWALSEAPLKLKHHALLGTHPSSLGLVVQGGHPGHLPLALPAIQCQYPGQERVRLPAPSLVRLRPPPGRGSRPGQRPLRQVQAHRAQGRDEEGHQDEPLYLAEPRAHADGAYPARAPLLPRAAVAPGRRANGWRLRTSAGAQGRGVRGLRGRDREEGGGNRSGCRIEHCAPGTGMQDRGGLSPSAAGKCGARRFLLAPSPGLPARRLQ